MSKVINIADKIAEKQALKERDEACSLLRLCKERGTPISKDSAKALFETAQWPYDHNSYYLQIPEEDWK